MTATKNRREGQPNGKCKCRWGWMEDGQWGKVFKACRKPVDFHLDEKTGRKVWHLTCLECRTQQAKHFGSTLKTGTVAKVAKPKVAKAAKVAKPKVVKKGKKVVKKEKSVEEFQRQTLGALLQELTAQIGEMTKAA